eukprot:12275831-Alexandrium_andersonii.AAC.1
MGRRRPPSCGGTKSSSARPSPARAARSSQPKPSSHATPVRKALCAQSSATASCNTRRRA